MRTPARIYEFGPFQLDLQAHRMLKDDTPVSLAPKSFDLLRILLENRSRAMSKSELLEALWPDTQVEEGNLAFQVSVLRKALGPEAGSWIETVPRHGYRFSAPVVVHPFADAPVPAQTRAAGVPPRRRQKRYLAAGLVLVAVAAAMLIATHQRAGVVGSDLNPSREHSVASRAVPLTAFHGVETDPSISPDGKYVALAWDGEKQDNFDIYVIEIRSSALRRITTDPGQDRSPAWSPDGRSIAFLRRLDEDRAALMLVPAAGGPEHRLGETRNDAIQRPAGLVSLAWSPDGRHVAASHREGRELHASIYLFSLTGQKRRLTAPPDDSWGDQMPAFSPDGSRLAFCRFLGFSSSEVYLLSLDHNQQPDGEAVRLTNHRRWSLNPVWAHGSSEVLYVLWPGSNLGTRREVRIASAAGDAASRALPIDGELWQISAGRHLVYSKRRGDVNIWRAKVPAPGQQPEEPVLFLSSTAPDSGARYSPDGKKIAFLSARSGKTELSIANADGSDSVRMTSYGGALISPPSWSPDGQWLVFHARPEGQSDLFVMPAAGGTPRRLTHHPSDDNMPTYSRDGRWIYFNSVRTGRLQVFRMPSGGGDAVQITTGGGRRPIESPDGKTLFYVSEGGNAIRQVPVAGGVETEVVNSVCPEFGFALTSDGLLLYPARAPGSSRDSCEFRLLALVTGHSRPVARVPARPLGLTVSISPDGRYFLFDQVEKPGMDLMLIENFLSR